MKKLLLRFTPASICVVFLFAACSSPYNPLDDYREVKPETAISLPEADRDSSDPQQIAQVSQGKYLVELLGCANCHTDGALVGQANHDKPLAGSSIGIAYTNPMEMRYPGILFPSNLTPDMETGIGSWSDIELMRMLRSGIDKHGRGKLSVMPWPAYAIVSDDDSLSIVSYLRSLEPVKFKVPDNVKPGVKSKNKYVHFGMYETRRND